MKRLSFLLLPLMLLALSCSGQKENGEKEKPDRPPEETAEYILNLRPWHWPPNPPTMGTIMAKPKQEGGTMKYKEGTEVQLQATPPPDYVFLEWQGDLEGNENPKTLRMDDVKAVTAIFGKPNFPQECTAPPKWTLFNDGIQVPAFSLNHSGFKEKDSDGDDDESSETGKVIELIGHEGQVSFTYGGDPGERFITCRVAADKGETTTYTLHVDGNQVGQVVFDNVERDEMRVVDFKANLNRCDEVVLKVTATTTNDGECDWIRVSNQPSELSSIPR